MNVERTPYWLEIAVTVVVLGIGVLIGSFAFDDTKTIDSRTVPTVVAVTLAPNGTAYCPADMSEPHISPCVDQP